MLSVNGLFFTRLFYPTPKKAAGRVGWKPAGLVKAAGLMILLRCMEAWLRLRLEDSMFEPLSGHQQAREIVIASIANERKPGQVVEVVHLPDKQLFVTRGISSHFGLKEVAVSQGLMLAEIGEMTGVISYLLERIATAADLNLPFRYDPEFDVNGKWYGLEDNGSFMLLAPMDRG